MRTASAPIDGPYLKVRDVEAFRRVAGRSAALGYDGKWVLHPDQIAAGNEIFSPRQADYDHAELILEAYEWHTSGAGGARGAVMLGDEMIDEASRKMALVIAAKGRAAKMERQSDRFLPPTRLTSVSARWSVMQRRGVPITTTSGQASGAEPTAIPAMANPRPCWWVCLIWLSATTPSTMATTATNNPMPQKNISGRTGDRG